MNTNLLRRGSFLAALAAAALLVGCASTPSSTTSIRVGTYNIRLQPGDKGTPNAWDERKEDMVKLIREMDLDAFGLQEVCPGQAEFLRERLPEYAYVGEHREADRKSGEASPVFFRKDRLEAVTNGTFWLSETPEVPGRRGWGAACPRVCSWARLRDRGTGRTFCFANTHTDHVSALARKNGMLLIIERMKEFGAGDPIVFTGDHNCNETEEPARAAAALLDNALFTTLTPPQGPWRTWNGWKWREQEVPTAEALKLAPSERNLRKGSPDDGRQDADGLEFYKRCGGPRIDYIYVSRGIKTRDYRTYGDARNGTKLYPSDHFPIAATIEF